MEHDLARTETNMQDLKKASAVPPPLEPKVPTPPPPPPPLPKAPPPPGCGVSTQDLMSQIRAGVNGGLKKTDAQKNPCDHKFWSTITSGGLQLNAFSKTDGSETDPLQRADSDDPSIVQGTIAAALLARRAFIKGVQLHPARASACAHACMFACPGAITCHQPSAQARAFVCAFFRLRTQGFVCMHGYAGFCVHAPCYLIFHAPYYLIFTKNGLTALR